MTHFKITVDAAVLFDGSVTEWERKAPDAFKDLLKPGHVPAPHIKSVMLLMADAAVSGRSATVVVETGLDDFGNDFWTQWVRYK